MSDTKLGQPVFMQILFGLKKLFVLLLFFMGSIASAEWLKLNGGSDTSQEKFIDTAAIRQTGPMNTMRRVWEVSNLTKDASSQVRSVKSYREYDCKDRRIRLLEESDFSEQWGKGENLTGVEHDAKAGNWQDIAKGSVGEIIFNRVCPNDDSDAAPK